MKFDIQKFADTIESGYELNIKVHTTYTSTGESDRYTKKTIVLPYARQNLTRAEVNTVLNTMSTTQFLNFSDDLDSWTFSENPYIEEYTKLDLDLSEN